MFTSASVNLSELRVTIENSFGSVFQTAGAEHRKARFAKVVVVEVRHSVAVVDRRLWRYILDHCISTYET